MEMEICCAWKGCWALALTNILTAVHCYHDQQVPKYYINPTSLVRKDNFTADQLRNLLAFYTLKQTNRYTTQELKSLFVIALNMDCLPIAANSKRLNGKIVEHPLVMCFLGKHLANILSCDQHLINDLLDQYLVNIFKK